MKKLLLASTALVASAGFASAQGIDLSGQAEMGIIGGEDTDTQLFTDIDVTFTMSGTADNGLTFGANIDLDESDGSGSCAVDKSPGAAVTINGGSTAPFATADADCSVNGASGAFGGGTQGGESIFVSFGGATLTMGDTDGAIDARVPEMALAGGSIADDETEHGGFDAGDVLDGAGDGQIARFDYAVGSLIASLSAEQEANGADDSDDIFGIGFSYTAALGGVDLNAGIGYQHQEDTLAVTSVAVTGTFASGLSLGATFSDWNIDGADDATHTGVGIGYTMNALAVGLNYGVYEQDSNTTEGYGLAVAYDLGGGLSLHAGYGYTSEDEVFGTSTDDTDTFSLGAQMNF